MWVDLKSTTIHAVRFTLENTNLHPPSIIVSTMNEHIKRVVVMCRPVLSFAFLKDNIASLHYYFYALLTDFHHRDRVHAFSSFIFDKRALLDWAPSMDRAPPLNWPPSICWTLLWMVHVWEGQHPLFRWKQLLISVIRNCPFISFCSLFECFGFLFSYTCWSFARVPPNSTRSWINSCLIIFACT